MFPLSYQNVVNINHNMINIGLSLYKNINMKLIFIKSTMEPKNYSTIRSILKKNKEKKLLSMFLKLIIPKQSKRIYIKKKSLYKFKLLFFFQSIIYFIIF